MMTAETGPLFSVVIPTYNRAQLIVRTLESVLAQSWLRFEVIIVDNCSTDGTVDVLEKYLLDGRIRLIRQDRNYERARSRNTGMEAASGEWLTFLDSDDLMYRDNLRDAAGFAAANPDLRCFHNLFELVDERGRLLYRYRFPSLRNQARALAEGNFLSCIGDFIHRDVYSRFRFDEDPDITGSEDWEFWLRVAAEHRVGRIEKINSGIVDHGARTVNNQDLDRLERRIETIIDRASRQSGLASVYGPHARSMRASALVYLAGSSSLAGDHRRALRFLLRALVASPAFAVRVRFIRTLQIALFRMDRMRSLRSAVHES